jgi:hypothetical protein
MDASSPDPIVIDETSARYDGWRIVVVCFLVATFGWGLGFHGQSVHLAELHRLQGWPTSLISTATTSFYLFGAVLVAFISGAVRSFGPRAASSPRREGWAIFFLHGSRRRTGQRKCGAGRASPHHEGYASRCRSRSSRSSRWVNIASDPSGVSGHCSLGRSQYNSTPFSSGSRRYSASLTP